MRRVLIFGNSGSGKSTLARELCEADSLAHLDLDTLAWLPTNPPQRMPLNESYAELSSFIQSHNTWVIEGCYADLLEKAAPNANEIIFLNPPITDCVSNAKNRPWEPHKYESKAAQDANLDMLIEWITHYELREDTFSKQAHSALYESFIGNKTQYIDNERSTYSEA